MCMYIWNNKPSSSSSSYNGCGEIMALLSTPDTYRDRAGDSSDVIDVYLVVTCGHCCRCRCHNNNIIINKHGIYI